MCASPAKRRRTSPHAIHTLDAADDAAAHIVYTLDDDDDDDDNEVVLDTLDDDDDDADNEVVLVSWKIGPAALLDRSSQQSSNGDDDEFLALCEAAERDTPVPAEVLAPRRNGKRNSSTTGPVVEPESPSLDGRSLTGACDLADATAGGPTPLPPTCDGDGNVAAGFLSFHDRLLMHLGKVTAARNERPPLDSIIESGSISLAQLHGPGRCLEFGPAPPGRCRCPVHGLKPCANRCSGWEGICYTPELLDPKAFGDILAALFERARHRRMGFPQIGTDACARREQFDAALAAVAKGGELDRMWMDETRTRLLQHQHFTATGNQLCLSYMGHRDAVNKTKTSSKRTSSALKTFQNDETLKKIIRRTILRTGRVSDERVADECYFRDGAWILNFQPLVAAALLRKYLGLAARPADRAVRYWDPCGGWGGRLLAALLCGVVDEYVCCEPSTKTHRGLTEFAKDISGWTADHDSCPTFRMMMQGSEVASPQEIGEIDIVFTSPPYFDLERYCDEPTQSTSKFPIYEDWLQGCLGKTFQTAYTCLRVEGYCLINITSTKSNPALSNLETDAVRVAKDAGFVLRECLEMHKPSTTGAEQLMQPLEKLVDPARASAPRPPEHIYVFQKLKK